MEKNAGYYLSQIPRCAKIALYPVRYASLFVFLLCGLCLMSGCRADRSDGQATKDTGNVKNANKTENPKAEYLPEIVKYLKQYAPVYTQAEEPEWMAPPGFHDLFKGYGSVRLSPLSWYKPCLDEALKGNPRGMVCMATVAGNSYRAEQQAMFSSKPDIPAAAYTEKYWMAWADKYMPPGWAETRQGQIFGGDKGGGDIYAMEKGYAEANYLAYHYFRSTEDLRKATVLGWPDALGQMALNLEEGGSPYRQDSVTAREYALRAGYACSQVGTGTLGFFMPGRWPVCPKNGWPPKYGCIFMRYLRRRNLTKN